MNAKEAYEKATEKLNETSEKEINNVLKLIEEESEKGKYATRYYDIICEATINYLKKLGYDVTYYCGGITYNAYYRISWEYKKESWLSKWIEKLKG